MVVITFMSDFGTQDHYVSAVKATIISKSPTQVIVDITHNIRPFDISHAAHVLGNVFHQFPEGTVHLAAVDTMKAASHAIAVKAGGHYFVGFDSGLFSLLTGLETQEAVVLETNDSTFPAKDVLSHAALDLASGKALSGLGKPLADIHRLFNRQLKVTKRAISGHVVWVDHFGNLITNIDQDAFRKIMEINGAGTQFIVRFGREAFPSMHRSFTDVESGDCYVLFNSSNVLQIGINKGNASQLLGLHIDAPIIIEFSPAS